MLFIFFTATYIVLCFGFVAKMVLITNWYFACCPIVLAQVQIFLFLPLNPSSPSKEDEGSSTTGTVESTKAIFLPYNVMVSNKPVFCFQWERQRKKGMRLFLTSKVAIAQKRWGPSTGGRWCVISFKKKHYIPLIMLLLS